MISFAPSVAHHRGVAQLGLLGNLIVSAAREGSCPTPRGLTLPKNELRLWTSSLPTGCCAQCKRSCA